MRANQILGQSVREEPGMKVHKDATVQLAWEALQESKKYPLDMTSLNTVVQKQLFFTSVKMACPFAAWVNYPKLNMWES